MLTREQILGKEAEKFVSAYLQAQGLKPIAANYSCKFGEIDLVMADNQTLVFIEVRYRQSFAYGDGAVTVDKIKQRKIIQTAACYLQQHDLDDRMMCRFDVVAISGLSVAEINWIKDAFWAAW